MALDISRVMLGCIDGDTNYATYSFPVASGVTVTAGDFFYFVFAIEIDNHLFFPRVSPFKYSCDNRFVFVRYELTF